MSCVRERVCCAFLTSSITCDRYVASPVAVTRMVTAFAPLMAPPIAVAPTPLVTGRDSPVSMASLKPEEPSVISPSTGTLAPGRTITRSPGCNALIGTSCRLPSPSMRVALSGSSLTSSSRAREAPMTERISTQCPSSMIAISVTSSQ